MNLSKWHLIYVSSSIRLFIVLSVIFLKKIGNGLFQKNLNRAEPILESKGMDAVFQTKGKKMLKNGKKGQNI